MKTRHATYDSQTGSLVSEVIMETDLAGSQDWAKIVREYASASLIKGILFGVILLFAAAASWKDWPTLGALFGIGGIASIAFVWWAGILAIIAGFLVVYAFKAGTASIKPPFLSP